MNLTTNQPDILTVRSLAARARQEGMPVSEYTIRRWLKQGLLPARRTGNRALIYYPNFLEYIRSSD